MSSKMCVVSRCHVGRWHPPNICQTRTFLQHSGLQSFQLMALNIRVNCCIGRNEFQVEDSLPIPLNWKQYFFGWRPAGLGAAWSLTVKPSIARPVQLSGIYLCSAARFMPGNALNLNQYVSFMEIWAHKSALFNCSWRSLSIVYWMIESPMM